MTRTPEQILHWLGRFLAGSLLLLAGGCGLAEYEAKMKETQDALDRYDEETHLLDEPIYVPLNPKKEGDDEVRPVVEIFFRPPRGVQQLFDTKPLQGLMYRYGRKPYVPAPPPIQFPDAPPPRKVVVHEPVPGIQEVLVGWQGQDPSKKPVELKDFATEVLNLFPAAKVDRPAYERKANSPGRPPFSYQTYEIEDKAGNHLSINFVMGTKTFVAIVYKIEKGKKASVDKAIQLSLETLAVDADAEPARIKYRKRGGQMTSPAPTAPN
jgi:hypothetical protein